MTTDLSASATTSLTHSSTMRRLLYEGLSSLGLDPTATYRRAYQGARLTPPSLDKRQEHDTAPLFWQALEHMTGDTDIGLHLGEVMKPRPMDVVGYLLLASRDLRQAIESFVRFQHILSGGFAARVEEQGEVVKLIIDLNYRGVGSLRQQIECLALLWQKQLSSVTDDTFSLTGVEFRHPQPRKISEHRRLFGVTPQFAQPHDALIFSQTLLTRPSRSANARLFKLLTEQAVLELAELSENLLLDRVRNWLDASLGQQRCGLQACAQALAAQPAALQRELAVQGSSFRALHDEVRRLRAIALLEQGMAARDVARACGFAELSPFYRAFRRWHGSTPGALQAQLIAGE